MRKRKPELISVKMVLWSRQGPVYGLETRFDDGVCLTEPWGSYDATFQLMEMRSEDIRGVAPRSRRPA
jgi:hypothetical protein